jgi:hypothetical protein
MNTKIVKNISDTGLAIVGIGYVKSGETIEVPEDFNNANFEEVVKSEPKKETKKEKVKEGEDNY